MAAPRQPPWDFLKLEYEAVRQKIAATQADMARTETIYPLAMTAIYVWLLTDGPAVPWLRAWAMWLPFLIGLLGVIRLESRQRVMQPLESYCQKLEGIYYGGNEPHGWEHEYQAAQPMKWFRRGRRVASLILVAGSFSLAVAAVRQPAAFTPPPADRSPHPSP